MEMDFTNISFAFKYVLKLCKTYGKIFSTPTQVTESGIKGAIPMLSQVNDIT